MLEVIIEIARHLSAAVVAEGVETEEQMHALKEIGCDMVQGYLFSPPVPPDQFIQFLRESEQDIAERESAQSGKQKGEKAASKAEKKHTWKKWTDRLGIPMKKASCIFAIVAFIASAALFTSDFLVTQGYLRMEQANDRYITAQQAAMNLEIGSDALTNAVRSFVVTGEITHMQEYFTEAEVTRRRDNAVDNLEKMMSRDSAAYECLSTALTLSNELMLDEYQAMKLILAAGDYEEALIPVVIRDTELSEEEKAESPEEKRARALELVYGDRYEDYKSRIRSNAQMCTQELVNASSMERVRMDNNMNRLLGVQTVQTVVMLAIVLFMVIFISEWIRKPLSRMVDQANVILQKPKDDLPPVSISVGVAFADRENPEGDIFKDADTALYRMKEAGRCGCYIY